MGGHQALAGQPQRGHPGALEVAVQGGQPGLVFGPVEIGTWGAGAPGAGGGTCVGLGHFQTPSEVRARSAFLSSLPNSVTANPATTSSRLSGLVRGTRRICGGVGGADAAGPPARAERTQCS